jgi:hypothetical protein
MTDNSSIKTKDRPEFMLVLGLLPPYSEQDVRQAYRKRAQQSHPDHGGDPKTFRRIHEAYERAQNYVAVRNVRSKWIAGKMDRYLLLQDVERRLGDLGASITTWYEDWQTKHLGEFAELMSEIDSVTVAAGSNGNTVIELMLNEQPMFQKLRRIVLADCGVNTQHAMQLATFKRLRFVNLNNNPVPRQIADLVWMLPNLKDFEVEGVALGWWTSRKIKRELESR